MNPLRPASRTVRSMAAAGAICAAASVALSAYASHAAAGPEQVRLFLAAGLGLVHGAALAALAPAASSRAQAFALALLLAGTVLFSGTLAAAHFFGTPTRLAPVGGSALIAGWLLQALAAWRR